jgi:two-component system, cell cycle sensor histidine kinase and response regulator CckA
MSNEALFRSLVESSADLLGSLKSDGRIDYVNPAVERFLGEAGATLAGMSLLDLIHPDDRTALAAALADDHPEAKVICRLRARSGAWVAFEMVVRHTGGNLVFDARDVSARRSAEEALRGSEERFRRLFEESRDAICIGTLDGRLLDINPAGVKLFGYDSKAEMLEVDIAQQLYWNPEDRKRTEAEFLAQGYVEDMELELRTKTGRKIRVIESATAFFDDQGEIAGFRGLLRDVTEHRKLEDQLRQSQKMEAVGRLAGGVAHDFNNLLTAINGYSELALARMTPEDPLRSSVEEIRKAGKRATDLTRRLLTLSRHQVVAPRKLNLNRIVVDMEQLLERVIGEDIQLRTVLDPELPPLYADQGQIEQVVLNLAVNARDAMPEGGALEIETKLVHLPSSDSTLPKTPTTGDFILLKVRDTGLGMEKHVRDHLFEPFFTTKGQGHNAGLGLAIVYGIVKHAGGYVDVESTIGQGATFFVLFPTAPPRRMVLTESASGAGEPLPRGRETILLVEDETSVRTLVRQILEQQGYAVLAARNAKSAVALCDESDAAPDLLLTDVVMPGRSGLALAEELQARFKTLKILFMSGYSDNHSGVKLLTERKAEFLAKPFTPEVLARKVREVFDA